MPGQDLQFDEQNDLVLTADGDVAWTSGQESVRQYLQQKLRTVQGEWFLDQSAGVPYIEEVLDKNASLASLDAVFKKAILTDTPGVDELIAFSMTLNKTTRLLTLDFVVRNADGEIDFSGDNALTIEV